MTRVKFLIGENGLYGFCIDGHSTYGCDDEVGRTVCSAVSSAAYMAANTVTEIIGDKAEAEVEDGYMRFEVFNPSEGAVTVLEGLRLHLTQLTDQYVDNIKIIGGADYVKN